MGIAAARWGFTAATGVAVGAVCHPQRPLVIEDRAVASYDQVHRRTNALARSLANVGVGVGQPVGLLARNGVAWVEGVVALTKVGADVVLLNTGFAAPQLADVAAREGCALVLHTAELAEVVAAAGLDGWDLARDVDVDDSDSPPPDGLGRLVILTSGTTGTPKGAPRGAPSSLDPAVALLGAIPYRTGERTFIAAPLFHAWGLGNFLIGLLLGSSFVLQERYDPEATLAALATNEASALVVAPVMIQRILALPEAALDRYPLSALRVVASSGSALPADLASRFMDRFGEVLYNLYGSTEVAWATIAGPEELRAAPGTTGRPPAGTTVEVLDDEGQPVPPKETGQVWVGSDLVFGGYTDGADKDRRGALMSTGDLGYWDDDGRLFVVGRADDMVVSGGENVFPQEVEDVIATHPGVTEAAVVGVPDEEFGQRLRAVVVVGDGAQLDADEIRAYVRERLARFKVPRDVVFVDALPRNPAGKVVKRLLPAPETR